MAFQKLNDRWRGFNDYMKRSIVAEMTPEETEYDERLRKTEIRDQRAGLLLCVAPVIVLIISLIFEITLKK